uniref:Uncharacterized protein LOC100184557 n=1 Tax=Phallusia mammillata TaxID=59560 RepID=A0A6F9DIB0_9ASCI|nr:uncharacterized protein LOC100184557 [Phallusia mammillata]
MRLRCGTSSKCRTRAFLSLLCFCILSLIGYQFVTSQYEIDVKRRSLCVVQPPRLKNGVKSVAEETFLTLMTCQCDYKLPNDVTIEVGGFLGRRDLTLDEYKVFQAKRFVDRFGRMRGSKVSSLPPIQEKDYSDPYPLLHDPHQKIEMEEIKAELQRIKQQHLDWGDDDLGQIPELQEALNRSTTRIPNIVHFVYFGCLKVRVDHYMAFSGVLRYQKPDLILFHTNCEPTGEYWEAFKFLAGTKLKIVKRSPPKSVWGIDIDVVEHKADVARLEILLEVGGIYLDTDSVVLTSLQTLQDNDLVLGEESERTLGNGVILTTKDSWFLHRWFLEYTYFKDGDWAHNSVRVPWALWRIFPNQITVVKSMILRPNWREVKYIYNNRYNWNNNYVMHLYSRNLWRYDGVVERTLKELAVLQSTYGEVARHAIWGDARARDVTEWIVTCNITEKLLT